MSQNGDRFLIIFIIRVTGLIIYIINNIRILVIVGLIVTYAVIIQLYKVSLWPLPVVTSLCFSFIVT